MYIYENPNWPNFIWDEAKITKELLNIRYKQGHLLGQLETLGFHAQEEATLQTLTQDVLKTSEIEGEILNKNQVRSSLARQLGLDRGGLIPSDRNVDGIVEVMLDATRNYLQPLTKERLWRWHASLFPTGYSGLYKIKVGTWRDDSNGPMRVLSGRVGREIIHFEAPPATCLDKEMTHFISWYNNEDELNLVVKSAIAHLWFLTLHPFADGNGRIGRAIADMMLTRSEKNSQRFYSLSAQIRHERRAYYHQLENTQKGTLEITPWLMWFLECLSHAIENAGKTFDHVLQKARFWEKKSGIPLNERQIKIINLLLEGFKGKLTTSKWAKLSKCSQDMAYRDILDLINKGILLKNSEGGRSTNYSLVLHYTQET